MKNKYEIRGDVTAILINSDKYGEFEALVSTSKLERVKEFPNTWTIRFSKSGSAFYVQGNNPRVNRKQTTAYLHRWVTKAPVGMHVDHINHDPLDNTDSNLESLQMEKINKTKKVRRLITLVEFVVYRGTERTASGAFKFKLTISKNT